MSLKIVFFGTPAFARDILDALIQQGADIVAVVTKPDKPVGRSKVPKPPPVKELALEKLPSTPLYQPLKASASEFASVLEKHQADLFVVAAYSEILKENILSLPKLDCINVHGSILPKYRGAAPVQRSVMNGDLESGVTIMQMVKKLDAGDMLKISKVSISEEMTAGELMNTLAKKGAEALWDVILEFERGKVIRETQDESLVTFAPKITLEDAKIDWDRPATELHNLIRGVTPKPGAWCEVNVRGQTKRLRIKKARIQKGHHLSPRAVLDGQSLIVGCGEGALELLQVQLEGKKEQPAKVFLQGFPKKTLHFL